ncbi:hypothetical protein ETAA8_11580 [Anatilimnocola aggregata]|uniref:Uncharacterized protein n=1 Tax=Anatilimnocola aggregata TaxID=2528021 RepID=A0A517Y773_9BACT|nr:hypothetical protein [Anatilimnocola aggregata]QDU26084.1 hypothetical protein ETAA8_11580 [Anatilimnocola aggregata]
MKWSYFGCFNQHEAEEYTSLGHGFFERGPAVTGRMYFMADSSDPDSINLKTVEGALCVTFTPSLTSEQLTELMHDTAESGSVRMHSIAKYILLLAKSWGREVVLDPCPPYPVPKAQG